MLGNYKIQTTLLGGFLSLAATLAIVGGVGLYAMRSLQAETDQIGTVYMPSLRGIALVNLGLADTRRLELALLQSRERKDDAAYAGNLKDFNAAVADELEKGLKQYEPLPRGSEEEVLWKAFSAALVEYRRIGEWRMATSRLRSKPRPSSSSSIALTKSVSSHRRSTT